MAAAITEIADAVVTLIGSADLSITPQHVVRKYLPAYDSSSTSLVIQVVGIGQAITDYSRSADAFEYSIAVSIYKGVDPDDVDAVDSMVGVVEEVVDLLRQNRVLIEEDAALVSVANDPAYNPEQLDKYHVFASVVRVNYRLLR